MRRRIYGGTKVIEERAELVRRNKKTLWVRLIKDGVVIKRKLIDIIRP